MRLRCNIMCISGVLNWEMINEVDVLSAFLLLGRNLRLFFLVFIYLFVNVYLFIWLQFNLQVNGVTLGLQGVHANRTSL